MATWDDVARLALALPETAESTSYGNIAWKVKGKAFVWERPLGKSDLKALGEDAPPEGPILGAYVEDLGEKEAVLAADPDTLFTIRHFDGFPAVLVLLDRVSLRAGGNRRRRLAGPSPEATGAGLPGRSLTVDDWAVIHSWSAPPRSGPSAAEDPSHPELVEGQQIRP